MLPGAARSTKAQGKQGKGLLPVSVKTRLDLQRFDMELAKILLLSKNTCCEVTGGQPKEELPVFRPVQSLIPDPGAAELPSLSPSAFVSNGDIIMTHR